MSSEAATTPPAPAKRTSLADLLRREPTVTMLGALIALAVIFFGILAPSRFLSGKRSAPWPARNAGARHPCACDDDSAHEQKLRSLRLSRPPTFRLLSWRPSPSD